MASPLPDGPIDTLGFLDEVLALPDELDEQLASGPVEDLVAATAIDHVVVATDAACVTAADVVAACAAAVSPVPVLPVGVGTLPAFVGPRSLVVAIGPEPSHAASAARALGAHVVQFAGHGSDVARLGSVPVATRVLLLLEQLGLMAEVAESITAAAAQCGRRLAELTSAASPSRLLARRVGRTLPIVYGADALGGAAARAWSRQVNQSAKVASFAGALPDIAAAEVAGWGQHGDMTRQVFSLVVLRHDHEPDGTAATMRAVESLLDEVVHERHVVEAEGDGTLAQLIDLVVQGDVFAYHLAQENEIDPGPVAAVDGMVEP